MGPAGAEAWGVAPLTFARTARPAGTIDLVTIQAEEVWGELSSSGLCLPNTSRSAYAHLDMCGPAYRWMSSRLAATCEVHDSFDPDAGEVFWAWASIDGDALISDLEAYGPGHVLLHLRVPLSRVLLSDFDQSGSANLVRKGGVKRPPH